MRKLYWAFAATGLAALGLHQVAHYTGQHPDALMTRCVLGAYHANVHVRPLYHIGEYLACRTAGTQCDEDEDVVDIPDEPEPVAESEPCPSEVEPEPKLAQPCPQDSGRLPGKIVIEDAQEPPVAGEAEQDWRWRPEDLLSDALRRGEYRVERMKMEIGAGFLAQSILDNQENSSEPNLDRMVERFVAQQFLEDTPASHFQPTFRLDVRAENSASTDETVSDAYELGEQESGRQMPYCTDDDEPELLPMPQADQPEIAPRKRSVPRIWNPFPPKGTEVGGGDEPELNPNGNDCREDPAAAQQQPAGPSSLIRTGRKTQPAVGREEESEPPPVDKKKSRRAEPPKAKRNLDESKLLPFAAPVKLDTMEFRPSDWGWNDVALPPF